MHGGAAGSGAPRGNRNAVRDGFYGAAARAERRAMNAFIRDMSAAVARLEKGGVATKPRWSNPTCHPGLVPGSSLWSDSFLLGDWIPARACPGLDPGAGMTIRGRTRDAPPLWVHGVELRVAFFAHGDDTATAVTPASG
jgi:hypothetical protein